MLPVLFENQVKAVIELASVSAFTSLQIAFLEQLTASIGIVLNTIEATMQTEGLLKQSQQLAGELQAQQRELQQTNEQLEQKAQQLAERNVEVERKNQEIEQARRALEEKATELALTSKYKSEFLANMSHELRTPLNSILILGQQLADNPDGNLSGKQVEFARTIHGAGTDLLNLISDILDLSKIESGTVTVEAEEICFANLLEAVARPFRHEAENRAAVLRRADRSASRAQHRHRLQAAAAGAQEPAVERVQVHRARRRSPASCRPPPAAGAPDHPVLSQAAGVVAFEVSDTGIGIPPEKQKIIFEAFQQADASTSRKYGGTGLGLAISRELSSLLGGEIQLRSTPGRRQHLHALSAAEICRGGQHRAQRDRLVAAAGRLGARPAAAGARRSKRSRTTGSTIEPGDSILLIVEDDPHYARVLVDLARDKGFKVLVAMRGTDALELAKQYQPTAVSLDVFLPDMLGWTVLSQLKQNPLTRHIPGADRHARRGSPARPGARRVLLRDQADDAREGVDAALTRIKEYAQPRRKRLLVVEDNAAEQMSITELLGHDDIEIVTAETGAEALDALRRAAVRLRRARPAAAGHDRLRGAGADPRRRVAVGRSGRRVHGPRADRRGGCAAAHDGAQHRRQGRGIARAAARRDGVVPASGRRRSAGREAAHARAADTAPTRIWSAAPCCWSTTMRATSSRCRSVLERRGMHVLTATTGREAIQLIESTPDVAIVLMDIMMPEMDGYQTMAGDPAPIRASAACRSSP